MKQKYPIARLHVTMNEIGVAENEAVVRTLGLPDVSKLPPPKNKHLAIVGGGHSITHRKNTLRNWKGDVWGVNKAALWCAQNKIDCTMVSIDPAPCWGAEYAAVKRAILAMRCHPELFALLRGADVHTFELATNQIEGGSASTMAIMAINCGYEQFTFFGCEGNFPPNSKHHAYGDVEEKECVVRSNGQDFLTEPSFLFTSFVIAKLIQEYPEHMFERSGGLLSALVEDPDYELVGVCPAMAGKNTPQILLDGYKQFVEAV